MENRRRSWWKEVVIVAGFWLLASGCATVGKVEEKAKIERRPGEEKNVTQITTQKKEDVWASVSPDGKKLAFMSRQRILGEKVPLNFDVWTVDTETLRSFTQITNHPADECYPTWAVDGKSVYFSSPRIYCTWAIWKTSLLGTGAATQITTRDSHDFAPSASPDGKKIAFTSQNKYTVLVEDRAGKIWTVYKTDLPYVWTANVDGTELTQIGRGVGPDWSPDGSRIIFYSNVTGNWDIWIMNPNGSALTQLTSDKSDQVTPAWSPDGKKIAFASNTAGNFDIWTMKADGSDLTQLTYNKKSDCGPVWSKDGKYIYFHSDRSGNWDIWRIEVSEE